MLTLSSLLTQGRAPTHPVYHDAKGTVSWAAFASRLARLTAYLSGHAGRRWLLACEDAGEFALWLVALLATGKQIVIPPNLQDGTLAQLAGECDASAGKLAIDDLPDAALHAAGIEAARLFLYTSGSSGDAKCIVKTAVQLEREVATHQALWDTLPATVSVVATVPHHHIYGLLFRLLWPLCSGRPFDTYQCAHPDMLQQRLRTLSDCVLIASPAQLARLPELIELDRLAPWPSAIFSSGGPLPQAAAQALQAHGGRAPIEIYGSTETGGIAWRKPVDNDWWTPLPGVRIEIQDGAAQLHSPFLADQALCRLDDAVELAADGRFRLLGRIDRIVKIEEKRLALPELERHLAQHPWVEQAAAVVLNGTLRQRIGIAMTLTPVGKAELAAQGRRGMRTRLREHLASHFDPVLLPRHWRYLEQLPYTAHGKLPTAALRELFAE